MDLSSVLFFSRKRYGGNTVVIAVAFVFEALRQMYRSDNLKKERP